MLIRTTERVVRLCGGCLYVLTIVVVSAGKWLVASLGRT